MNLKKFIHYNRTLSEKFSKLIGLYNNNQHSSKFDNYNLKKAKEILTTLSNKNGQKTKVLDIGCGMQSYLTDINKSDYNYTLCGMDISETDLLKNIFLDQHIVFDACNADYENLLLEYKGKFDLVVSHTFLEHIPSPSITNKIIHFLLKNDGYVIHNYPTLYDPLLFLGNIIPTKLAEKILFFIEPFREETGKFKTYYKNCFGYNSVIKKKYKKLNFKITEARNFYGSFYLYSLFPLQAMLDIFYLISIKFKISLFSTYSTIVLKKMTK